MKTKTNKIILSLLFGIFIFVASFASIETKPFGLGFFLASYMCCLTLLTAPFYALGALINDFSYLGITIFSMVILLTVFSELLLKQKAYKNTRLVVSITTIVMVACLKGILQKEYFVALYVILCVLSLMIAYSFLRKKSLKYKPAIQEVASAFLCIAIAVCGLTNINIPFSPQYFLYSFFMFLFSAVSPLGGMCLAVCIGAGIDLAERTVMHIGFLCFANAVALIFRDQHKALNAFAGIMAFCVFNYYFLATPLSIYALAFFVLGAIAFCFVPAEKISELVGIFDITQTRLGVRHMLNKNKKDISKTLNKSSVIFSQMQQIMLDIAEKKDDLDVFAEQVFDIVEIEACKTCSKFEECKSGSRKFLYEFVKNTFLKEKVSVLDIPQDLMNECINISKVIAVVAEANESIRKKQGEKKTVDVSRKLVAEQLGGMSKILYNLSVKEGKPFSNNLKEEKNIMNDLLNHNIVCSEVFVSYDEKEPTVTIIALKETINIKRIEKSVTQIMHTKMRIDSIDDAFVSGYEILSLVTCPKYDVVFSVAHKALHEICGDVHSFIKIDNDKFLMALSDGMGSGKKAAQISDIAITLVENFYKAGFESPLILESVNKFLSLTGEESYTAVDIVTVDLSTGEANVIKIGSPSTYVRSEDSTAIIEGGALPLGVLEEMRPLVSIINLKHSDMVLLVTDGVADNFESDELAGVINNIDSINTETVAKSVIDAAFKKCCKTQKDDMSVAVLRVVEV